MADLSSLLQLSQQMQGRLTEIQRQLAQQTLTVSAGGGMVQATVDGRGHIRAIKIDPQAVSQGDVEMLEDLDVALADRLGIDLDGANVSAPIDRGLYHPATGRYGQGLLRQLPLDLGQPPLHLLAELEQAR